ncbi:M1 family metallopeptidase [Micromonospora sp. ALFpr18c]|uniref:M1 family metallopeptidase n=1 Tax=unclassified Micromonospora TaxID=2617518 RepID=UPI00124B6248|nr:M1 family metallopeptidase [Micromonospora sp. ALFpr18c]KAB1949362.1 M1 family metallopeptidase [Micromonospora sp. ALFpr18c]
MRKRALPNGMVAVGLLLAAALTPTPAVAAAAPPTVGAGAVMPHLTALQEIAEVMPSILDFYADTFGPFPFGVSGATVVPYLTGRLFRVRVSSDRFTPRPR